MKRVELIYDPDCPNVEATRKALRQALAQSKQSVSWREWIRGAEESPPYTSGFASPTILVDGKDIEGTKAPSHASSCRLYACPRGGFQGAPPAETILRAVGSTSARSPVSAGAISAPGLGVLRKRKYPHPFTARLFSVARCVFRGLQAAVHRRMVSPGPL